MRLTLDALETLTTIAEAGSFARAAERLHRVPSALTYTVNKLESDLGVTLFDRTGKRPELTAAGRELIAQGRDLVQQAEALETRVKRVAHGWETQLTIAVDEVIPLERLFSLVSEFDALVCGTRIRFCQEVLTGTWDALIDRRAELVVGAPGDPPQGFDLSSVEIGRARFVYAVAPFHPLAEAAEPIPARLMARYRAVVAADSTRKLPPRTMGVQPNQDVLIVPSLEAKREAQVLGLGAGFLPETIAREEEAVGRLVVKRVASQRDDALLRVAWRTGDEGRACAWFRDRVVEEAKAGRLIPSIAPPSTVSTRAKARAAATKSKAAS
jgi:DNA-binding transcriptional LysR family regulator